MSDTAKRIAELEKELAESINGYISRKVIKGKERFYICSGRKTASLKSRYIKAGELEQTSLVERRKSLQAELKNSKRHPTVSQSYNLKRKAVRNMQKYITGTLMSEDRVIATVKNGVVTDADKSLLPLYLKRTGNIEGWPPAPSIPTEPTRAFSKSLASAHNGRHRHGACGECGDRDRPLLVQARRLVRRI